MLFQRRRESKALREKSCRNDEIAACNKMWAVLMGTDDEEYNPPAPFAKGESCMASAVGAQEAWAGC